MEEHEMCKEYFLFQNPQDYMDNCSVPIMDSKKYYMNEHKTISVLEEKTRAPAGLCVCHSWLRLRIQISSISNIQQKMYMKRVQFAFHTWKQYNMQRTIVHMQTLLDTVLRQQQHTIMMLNRSYKRRKI